MIIDQEQWKRFIEGYHVTGGAIGFDNTRYCFVLEETERNIHRDPPPVVRLLFARMERPMESRFFRIDFSDVEWLSVAYALTAGIDEFIGADLHGTIITYNDVTPKKEIEEPGILTRWRHDRSAPVSRVKRVNGRLYAICHDRRILEREAPNQWKEFPGLERPVERTNGKAMNIEFGFSDMDAFSTSDLYAAGGNGDLWHYNGTVWRRCLFPSVERLETVCCASNGQVYITGNMGSLWTGREDQWQRISTGKYTVPFNDTLSFAGKLWLANDYALYTLEGNSIHPANVPPEVQLSTGKLSLSTDGSLMLSAGKHGASLYDGKVWQVLFNSLVLTS